MGRRRRILRQVVGIGGGIALMYVFAYSVSVLGNIIGFVSARPSGYEVEIAKLEFEGNVLLSVAVAAPFLSAFLLGFTTTWPFSLGGSPDRPPSPYARLRSKWIDPILSYLVRVAVAIVGAVFFLVVVELALWFGSDLLP